ncbi:MAG: flagellin FliC [Deltaproteobacteria bacterium]|nr:flagellin FliC [Deltaproteobacteria bacterium]
MAVVINTNVASLGAQRTLARTTNALQRNIEKLSSGQRINRAADDAAGMGISENLKAQTRSLSQAERNANDGISMIQVAEAAMNEQAGVLTRLRELAVQSSNGVLTSTERAFIDAESDALVAEVDRISSVTEFNGIAMIANGTSSVNMHVGLNATANDQISVAFTATDAATLGTGGGGNALSTIDLATSQASAQGSIGIIDAAISDLSTARSTLGATQNRLEVTVSNLSSTRENLAAANSRIRDVDVAEETAQLTRNQILSQAGVAVLAQANQLPSAALSLLG